METNNLFSGIEVPDGSVLIATRGLVVDKAGCRIEAVVNGIEDEGARMDYTWLNKDSKRIFIEVKVDKAKGLRTFSIVRFADRESKELFVMKYGMPGGRVVEDKDWMVVIPEKMN